MSKTSIVIVEDEPEIAELMRYHLSREGYEVAVDASGRAALARIEARPPDLVLLDLMLPDLDGLEVCRRLKRRPQTQGVPVLIVSAKGEEADVVSGIELGADDYVTKPFSPRVLVARVKNLLRRFSPEEESQQRQAGRAIALASGALVIDPDRHVVTADEKIIDLTLTEFGIIHFLAKRPGFVRTRDQIISAVHGESTVLSSRTVDVHVTALRRKLGEYGALIQTVRGVGYRLSEPATVPDE